MKVLWLCNVIIPQISSDLGIEIENGGGWLTQLADMLDKVDNIELGICAPYRQGRELTKKKWGHNSIFWGFQNQMWNPCRYDSSLEVLFRGIIEEFNPDIVHIFGTEFPHTLAMVKAFNKPDQTVIHIQGLVSVYAQHYCAYLPCEVTKKRTFRDFIKRDNIIQQKRKFELRGEFEVEALKQVGHVMGRTDWDRACCEAMNPNIKYHYVQEMMRAEFYEGQWSYDDCEKHSIFMSQGSYPIKGLHLALEALYMLKKHYPDIKMYIAGSDIVHYDGIKQKIRMTYYSKYIMELLDKWELWDKVVFLGPLNAQAMKERYLLSHVFLSPSVIENSPNSIGEAMLLGTPIVASDVGGVASLVTHKENGFLYQAEAPYMLAYYVKQLFENRELAEQISEAEIHRATDLYDREKIVQQVEDVYWTMLKVADE